MNSTGAFSQDSKITVRMALVVLAAVLAVSGAWTGLMLQMNDLRHTLVDIRDKMEEMVEVQSSHLERAEWRAWCRELKALNQELNVPMPD